MQIIDRIAVPQDKPKSLLTFLAGLLVGLFVFVPMIIAGLSLERVMLMLAGAAGLAVVWLPAAFMALLFTARLAAGFYREIQPRPWREQVW
jgi:hypothetical protein